MTDQAFATTTQMEQRSLGAITATSHQFLATELAAASRAIRNDAGWHIATTRQVVLKRRQRYAETIWLPAMEIVSISAATVDGTVLVAGDVEFDPETGWTNLCGRNYDITFTAGYTEVPEDVVAVTLEVAAIALGSPLGWTREQAGSVSVSIAKAGGGLTDDQKNRLAHYKIGRLP